VVALGYAGSLSLLAQTLLPRRGPRLPPGPDGKRRPGRPRVRRLKARWLCVRPPGRLDPEERAALDRLLAESPDLAAGHSLVQRFRALVAGRDAAALGPWLDDAHASGLAPFVSLADGIAADRAAVDAALALPWSNGPVEGQISRIKLLKRRGYGRAALDLLRARILAV
jgi:transposase